MAKKAGITKQKNLPENSAKKKTNIFDYLRFGESYTSLILGIIVVIIGTALLLSFVHNNNAGKINAPISHASMGTRNLHFHPAIGLKACNDFRGFLAFALSGSGHGVRSVYATRNDLSWRDARGFREIGFDGFGAAR